jgi:hypothetical protein
MDREVTLDDTWDSERKEPTRDFVNDGLKGIEACDRFVLGGTIGVRGVGVDV